MNSIERLREYVRHVSKECCDIRSQRVREKHRPVGFSIDFRPLGDVLAGENDASHVGNMLSEKRSKSKVQVFDTSPVVNCFKVESDVKLKVINKSAIID